MEEHYTGDVVRELGAEDPLKNSNMDSEEN